MRKLGLLFFLPLAGTALAVSLASAQQATPSAAQAQPEAVAPRPPRQTVAQRFAEANTTHDGHLTLDQAKAGFPAMARLFDAIDRDRKGFITMEDIRAYYEAKRAARRAAESG